jgi:hypothetical protein
LQRLIHHAGLRPLRIRPYLLQRLIHRAGLRPLRIRRYTAALWREAAGAR